jgi:hypothetical protein
LRLTVYDKFSIIHASADVCNQLGSALLHLPSSLEAIIMLTLHQQRVRRILMHTDENDRSNNHTQLDIKAWFGNQCQSINANFCHAKNSLPRSYRAVTL